MLLSARSHKFGRQGHGGVEDDDDDYGGSASGYNGYSYGGGEGAGEFIVTRMDPLFTTSLIHQHPQLVSLLIHSSL